MSFNLTPPPLIDGALGGLQNVVLIGAFGLRLRFKGEFISDIGITFIRGFNDST